MLLFTPLFDLYMSNFSATDLISKSIHHFKLFAQNLINIHELNLCRLVTSQTH